MIAATGSTPNTKGWMQGGSTPLRGALLGLLLERPGPAGELGNRLIARLGETWRLVPKDVYRLLEQLEEEGLAASAAEPRRGRERRTRVVYHPTERTAAALTEWMERLLPREPIRLGLQAKLAVAREEDVPRLLRALREYERECLELAQLVAPSDGGMPCWAALFVDCTRDSVYGMLQAEIDWAGRTRRRIGEYAARHAQSSPQVGEYTARHGQSSPPRIDEIAARRR
jgi:DNA-binding PadR family transcriptional regulator